MFNKTVLILTLLNLISLTTGSLNSSPLGTYSETETASNVVVKSTAEISPYDPIFRSISESEGTDWRLMCAMAYHESRFKPDVVSRCGATGIMQIMPRVATQFDVSRDRLINVEDNIMVANRIFNLIEGMLKVPASASEEDRTKLTLAAYNGGIGRVADARRLAKAYGQNPNSWSDVSEYLKLLSTPEYYEHEVVKYGRFAGARETVAYVNNVMNHYQNYCLVAMK